MLESLEKKYVQIPEDGLSKYGERIDELSGELEQLRRKPELSEQEIGGILQVLVNKFPVIESKKGDSVDNPKFVEILENIVQKIKKECGDIENFKIKEEALKLYSPLLSKIIYRHDKNPCKEKHAKGYYSPNFEKIALEPTILKGMKFPRSSIFSLVASGTAEKLEAPHHEVIHSKHHKKSIKKVKQIILAYFASLPIAASIGLPGMLVHASIMPIVLYKKRSLLKGEEILKEAHAFRGSLRYASTDQSTEKIYKTVEEELIKTSEDIDRLIVADQEIKQLYALEVPEEEIGELVDAAKWDKERAVYKNLEDKVKELMEEKNIDEEDVNDLVLANDLKRKIYFLKVKHIAQGEIERAYNEIQEDKIDRAA